jgi:hypothetical protein
MPLFLLSTIHRRFGRFRAVLAAGQQHPLPRLGRHSFGMPLTLGTILRPRLDMGLDRRNDTVWAVTLSFFLFSYTNIGILSRGWFAGSGCLGAADKSRQGPSFSFAAYGHLRLETRQWPHHTFGMASGILYCLVLSPLMRDEGEKRYGLAGYIGI